MNTIPDSTLTRAYERIQVSGMDELLVAACAVLNTIDASPGLRREYRKIENCHARAALDQLRAVLEKMGR